MVLPTYPAKEKTFLSFPEKFTVRAQKLYSKIPDITLKSFFIYIFKKNSSFYSFLIFTPVSFMIIKLRSSYLLTFKKT